MPGRAFAVKPSENPLPKRDWRRTRSQSILVNSFHSLVAMEVFNWRSGPVGFCRNHDELVTGPELRIIVQMKLAGANSLPGDFSSADILGVRQASGGL